MPLYPASVQRPPITLLVMSVASNIIYDPSRDELAVADSVLAISVGQAGARVQGAKEKAGLSILAIRTIDPPSRLTNSGNSAAKTEAAALASKDGAVKDEGVDVWKTPRGGVKRAVLSLIVKEVVRSGGVGEEVLEALEGVEG